MHTFGDVGDVEVLGHVRERRVELGDARAMIEEEGALRHNSLALLLAGGACGHTRVSWGKRERLAERWSRLLAGLRDVALDLLELQPARDGANRSYGEAVGGIAAERGGARVLRAGGVSGARR